MNQDSWTVKTSRIFATGYLCQWHLSRPKGDHCPPLEDYESNKIFDAKDEVFGLEVLGRLKFRSFFTDLSGQDADVFLCDVWSRDLCWCLSIKFLDSTIWQMFLAKTASTCVMCGPINQQENTNFTHNFEQPLLCSGATKLVKKLSQQF